MLLQPTTVTQDLGWLFPQPTLQFLNYRLRRGIPKSLFFPPQSVGLCGQEEDAIRRLVAEGMVESRNSCFPFSAL